MLLFNQETPEHPNRTACRFRTFPRLAGAAGRLIQARLERCGAAIAYSLTNYADAVDCKTPMYSKIARRATSWVADAESARGEENVTGVFLQ